MKPVTTVEIAFNVGWATPTFGSGLFGAYAFGGTPTWTDVTAYVQHANGIDLDKWRAEEFSECQPSRASFTLNNSTGRFTPGLITGPYYPGVTKGRQIRVRSTVGGVTTTRFTGYIDDWSVDWPAGVTTFATCTVTASSRMARLGSAGELKSIVEEEYLLDFPAAYYTMGEAEGATTAADSSGNYADPLTQVGSGTAVVFGTATGPGTDGLTAATFAGGKYLTVTLPGGGTGLTLEFFFNTTATSGVLVANGDGPSSTGLKLDGTGKISDITGTVTSANAYNDGETHHAALAFTNSAVADLYVDGVNVGTTAALFTNGVGTWVIGQAAGVLAHLSWTNSKLSGGRIADHANSGLTGFEGDVVVLRLLRYASFVGIPAAECDFETGSVPNLAHIDTTGKTALACMREVETTESGVLFDAGDGSLQFHSRSHRYAATSAFTLNLASGAVTAPLAPTLDDQQMVNDETVTGSTGITARVTNEDSVEEYGPYRNSLDVATSDADEPLLAANWRVGRYYMPVVRVPQVEVHLNKADAVITAAVLAAEVGTKFTLTGLPANAPASSMVLFVEGMTEHIDNDVHVITLRTSDASLFNVWQLDSTTYSMLGTTTRLAY